MTFRILADQMQTLAAQTRQGFVTMMSGYLRKHFALWVKALGEANLDEWVGQALSKAAEYGVDSEPEAAQLILLLTVLGLDADERHDWVKQVLDDPDLAAIGKVKKLIAKGRAEHPRIEHVLVYDGLED